MESIIIIGAGIAGLAAGCYAQMNGYRSQIFELHDLPGGLCTAWEGKGYVIDGCIHYLFGSGAGQPFHNVSHSLAYPSSVMIVASVLRAPFIFRWLLCERSAR